MPLSSKLKTVFRGDIPLADLPREAVRRKKAAARQKGERGDLEKINNAPARLADRLNSLSPAELLQHFRERSPSFFQFDNLSDGERLKNSFPDQTNHLIEAADAMIRESEWELAGFGVLNFNAKHFWRCDPLTGKDWGTEYHADVVTYKSDGADIRVLWELNRFGHADTLACAYAITGDENYAETFFSHIESWMKQNPYARGANWDSAMEVALRAVNLLAAFDILRKANALTEERLAAILKLFDQHARFIVDNNEFSYIATSNHYLSDVVGLFWIGTFLPELEHARKWRDFGFGEMLREMDKQILPDGADFEASTGYHKFVTELFLYSFILATRSRIEVRERYLEKLRLMLRYLQTIIRPDNRMPLIGDADGSQIIPIIKRDADDAAYLLSIGAAFFKDETLKPSAIDAEVFWLLGKSGVSSLKGVKEHLPPPSRHFPNAGAVVMRQDDFYLHFNANDCGINGRGSHAHNDALSIEISVLGRPFIIDPGSYVYNLDREARHIFRSTAYHSTVMIDDAEQNTTNADLPFVLGNEARPIVNEWITTPTNDRVSAEHHGYMRLADPVMHRRTIEFNMQHKYWAIEDDFIGKGGHKFSFAFHLASGIRADRVDKTTVRLYDSEEREIFICVSDINASYEIVPAFTSRNYGHKQESSILKWEIGANAPLMARFIIGPNCLQYR